MSLSLDRGDMRYRDPSPRALEISLPGSTQSNVGVDLATSTGVRLPESGFDNGRRPLSLPPVRVEPSPAPTGVSQTPHGTTSPGQTQDSPWSLLVRISTHHGSHQFGSGVGPFLVPTGLCRTLPNLDWLGQILLGLHRYGPDPSRSPLVRVKGPVEIERELILNSG